MAFNKNELILDRVRSMTFNDLSTGKMLFRLTQLEDPTLTCTSEGEEVTDALGSVITTLYRSKKATFSATNSLVSLDLAAAQYGTKKEVAESGKEIVTRTFETITIPDSATTVKLAHKPANKDDVKFIYSIANGELGKSYTAGATASEKDFVVDEDGAIILPTGLTGKIYVEYEFKTENAVRIVNKASKFPEAAKVVIYAIFRDACNENVVYSGVIVCPKAKFNPESVELALTSTGKHAFELNMMKDYCEDDGDLFTIIVNE
nr:MAG TPA: putative structural protein [Caudoviricetes sp.]